MVQQRRHGARRRTLRAVRRPSRLVRARHPVRQARRRVVGPRSHDRLSSDRGMDGRPPGRDGRRWIRAGGAHREHGGRVHGVGLRGDPPRPDVGARARRCVPQDHPNDGLPVGGGRHGVAAPGDRGRVGRGSHARPVRTGPRRRHLPSRLVGSIRAQLRESRDGARDAADDGGDRHPAGAPRHRGSHPVDRPRPGVDPSGAGTVSGRSHPRRGIRPAARQEQPDLVRRSGGPRRRDPAVHHRGAPGAGARPGAGDDHVHGHRGVDGSRGRRSATHGGTTSSPSTTASCGTSSSDSAAGR